MRGEYLLLMMCGVPGERLPLLRTAFQDWADFHTPAFFISTHTETCLVNADLIILLQLQMRTSCTPGRRKEARRTQFWAVMTSN